MSTYMFDIIIAVVVFPILAALLTLPYCMWYYRKFGGISYLRGILFFSFVFYFLCVIFLILLPLPSRAAVAAQPAIPIQKVPFQFFRQAYAHGLRLKQPSTWIPFLTGSFALQFIFNVIMMVPFGIYMRYYFERGFVATMLLSLAASFCFECSQYTGVFGIYAHAFRTADVDDLICNTLGGVIGYLSSPFFTFFLPERSKLDEYDRKRMGHISAFRRMLALVIDNLLISFLMTGISFLSPEMNEWVYRFLWFGVFAVYEFVFLCLLRGKTIGMLCMNYKVVRSDGSRPGPVQYLVRSITLTGVIGILWVCVKAMFSERVAASSMGEEVLFAAQALMILLFALLVLQVFLMRKTGKKRDFIQGIISGTYVVSGKVEK